MKDITQPKYKLGAIILAERICYREIRARIGLATAGVARLKLVRKT